MAESSSTERRPVKPKVDNQNIIERVEKLEKCLEKVASLTGNGNILNEFGLERWLPGKKDMTKFKND